MTAAQGGDRRALDTLLRRHYDYAFAICRRMCGNEADALDATQEGMIAMVRGLPRYDGRAAFTTWTYRVVTNACLDELRRRKRRPVVELPDLEAEPTGGAPRIDDQVIDRLAIDHALDQVPIDYRIVIVLRDQLGLDYAEIAEVVGIPPGTVRSRIARGRTALARALEGNQNPARVVGSSADPLPRSIGGDLP